MDIKTYGRHNLWDHIGLARLADPLILMCKYLTDNTKEIVFKDETG